MMTVERSSFCANTTEMLIHIGSFTLLINISIYRLYPELILPLLL